MLDLPRRIEPHRRDRFTFIERMLAPCVTIPQPPVITRRTGRPVFGSFFNGGSLILCSTSKRRGFIFRLLGIVS